MRSPAIAASRTTRCSARRSHAAGCAIIGQTGDLAPADKRLYAIRDVTATVESVPLITASILSKKLAAGLQSLVLDVKIGNGAFMADIESARELARSLVEVANGAGLKTTALITDMNEPLASAAGNAVEVLNAVAYLIGARRDPRLDEVVLALAAEMLTLGGIADGRADGEAMAREALESGACRGALPEDGDRARRPADFVDDPRRHLPKATVVSAGHRPQADGTVAAIDTRALGLAVVALGGGRTRAEDRDRPFRRADGSRRHRRRGRTEPTARTCPCARRGVRSGRRRDGAAQPTSSAIRRDAPPHLRADRRGGGLNGARDPARHGFRRHRRRARMPRNSATRAPTRSAISPPPARRARPIGQACARAR